MGISSEQWRSTIGLFDGLSFRGIHKTNYIKLYLNLLFKTFKILGHFIVSVCFIALKMVIEIICNAHFSFILVMLMLLAYDIEQNPGSNNPRQAELSILHLNIRSFRNKTDYIKDNLLDFNILCFSKTHLNQ